MPSTSRKCLKGWMLAPSPTDGEYMPFFVQVRDKDIHWNKKNLPEELIRIANKGEDAVANYPMYQWKFKLNGWYITLHQDNTYTARRHVSIGDTFYLKTTQNMETEIQLPFKTINNDSLNVQTTINSTNTDIMTSFVSVSHEKDEVLEKIKLNMNNVLYYFNEQFETNDIYDKEFIYVTIHGNISLA